MGTGLDDPGDWQDEGAEAVSLTVTQCLEVGEYALDGRGVGHQQYDAIATLGGAARFLLALGHAGADDVVNASVAGHHHMALKDGSGFGFEGLVIDHEEGFHIGRVRYCAEGVLLGRQESVHGRQTNGYGRVSDAGAVGGLA